MVYAYSPVVKSFIDKALDEFESGNSNEYMVQKLIGYANAGYPEAASVLAYNYVQNKKDYVSGFPWLLKGAEEGDAYCMLHVARAYLWEKGTKYDLFKAHKWAMAGAGQNTSFAYLAAELVGDCYCHKKIRDYNKAKQWYQTSIYLSEKYTYSTNSIAEMKIS